MLKKIEISQLNFTAFFSILFFSEASGKHTAPVWQLYWIEVEKGRDDDTGEVLMSISTGSNEKDILFEFFECLLEYRWKSDTMAITKRIRIER